MIIIKWQKYLNVDRDKDHLHYLIKKQCIRNSSSLDTKGILKTNLNNTVRTFS